MMLVPLLTAAFALAIFLIWRQSQRQSDKTLDDLASANEKVQATDPYEDIEPLTNFDWSTTTPFRIRPFKPKYHITMGKVSRLIPLYF
jgi:hypothetical protein